MSADGFSRGTDHPLGGVVEEAPRVWRVGDVVGGEAAYASLPVGTTVWWRGCAPGDDDHFLDEWDDVSRLLQISGACAQPRVIRSLPAAPAAAATFDAASAPVGTVVCCTTELGRTDAAAKKAPNVWEPDYDRAEHKTDAEVTLAVQRAAYATIRHPPAPAERQPCAAWELRGVDGTVRLAAVEVSPCGKKGWAVFGIPVGGFFPTLSAAQLAAEDALESDARQVLALLGKEGA